MMIEPLKDVLAAARVVLVDLCHCWETKKHFPMAIDPHAVVEQIDMHLREMESVPQRSREEAIKSLTECMEQYMAELS